MENKYSIDAKRTEVMEIQNLKVLICEDDVVSAFALATKLQTHNIEVVAQLQDAENIIEKIPDLEFNLVIMDVWLKSEKTGGIRVASQIREGSNVPIIFQTGYTDSEILTQLHNFSNSYLVKKPYQMEQFLSLVQGIEE